MRENPFLCRVYICKSAKQEDRGGEGSPPLILYIEKGEGKGGSLGWVGKDFLFIMASILLVSLIRRNNQGIIYKVAQIFLSQNGRLISV